MAVPGPNVTDGDGGAEIGRARSVRDCGLSGRLSTSRASGCSGQRDGADHEPAPLIGHGFKIRQLTDVSECNLQHYFLCDRHRSRETQALGLGWLGLYNAVVPASLVRDPRPRWLRRSR